MTQPRDSHGRFKADHSTRNTVLAASAGVAAAIGVGVLAAFRTGLVDRLRPAREGHEAPDLAADSHPDGSNRAPEAFRPDPTAPVDRQDRESLRPPPPVDKGFTHDPVIERA